MFSTFGVGSKYPTKAALKKALAEGKDVYLRDYSAFADNSLHTNDIKEGEKVGTIVGPDPETNRKWYANIARKNGKLVVT